MRIEVSNIGPRVTDDSLSATFSAHGAVSQARVRPMEQAGDARRMGFIEMPNDHEAVSAILRINGAIIDGQTITVRQGL